MAVMRQRAWSILGIGLLGTIALSACGKPVEHKKAQAATNAALVESLERQISERDKRIEDRDKRIEDLESRLGALKTIDRDIERQKKYIQAPATLKSAK